MNEIGAKGLQGNPGEMTISQYDMEVFRHQQELAKQRHDRAVARWENSAIAVGWIALACAIVAVSFIVWQGVKGPSADEEIEDSQKRACTESRGTWIRVADGDTSSYGTCLFGKE